MDMSSLLGSTPPAVAIEEPVWAKMVKYPLAPDCENERLQRLIYHGFKALSQAPSGQSVVAFGYFCLPPDGDQRAPLWQDVCIRREHTSGQVTLTFDH
ncbi:hypothetical protein [Salmonella enterica]|uniref:hypothetical protein n=1 Tax=Salmonella enterica TaxID=28901 RepID=UPI0003BB3A8E|nr:hypothetical protein [Salmonella enterica]EBW5498225.1 hypothetical protein [Salmonella enterica subsp. enterica serovar Enteritidis]EBW7865136.1 hypothetical protein [Salmonella enterica subsp. enterica serovar Newport]ECB5847402.1 hypothetical protein [Salmonella enterica subsp. enterica serovar Stanley]ECE0588352.1 hypothetical protein [Salmonella enterica subsp. enterica]ECH8301307.1 hypothetical protein [Salmonella enterica subsp. enterica serovar Lexington]ECH8773998.1 hypothetical p